MNERLEALRMAMDGPMRSQMQVHQPMQASPSAAQMIAQLRNALAIERRARMAAEARLKSVLNSIARRDRQVMAPAPSQMIATPMLPSADPQVIEPTEVIEPDDVRSAIMDIGGDDFDEENDDG